VNVTVTTNGGTSATSSAVMFTYLTPSLPTPPANAAAGGTPVSINQTNLAGATRVSFGDAAGTITATSPPG